MSTPNPYVAKFVLSTNTVSSVRHCASTSINILVKTSDLFRLPEGKKYTWLDNLTTLFDTLTDLVQTSTWFAKHTPTEWMSYWHGKTTIGPESDENWPCHLVMARGSIYWKNSYPLHHGWIVGFACFCCFSCLSLCSYTSSVSFQWAVDIVLRNGKSSWQFSVIHHWIINILKKTLLRCLPCCPLHLFLYRSAHDAEDNQGSEDQGDNDEDHCDNDEGGLKWIGAFWTLHGAGWQTTQLRSLRSALDKKTQEASMSRSKCINEIYK